MSAVNCQTRAKMATDSINMPLDAYWTRIKHILDPYWTHIKQLLKAHWTNIVFLLNPYWNHNKTVMEPYWTLKTIIVSLVNPYWDPPNIPPPAHHSLNKSLNHFIVKSINHSLASTKTHYMHLAAMQHPHSTLINDSIFITHSAITWRQCRKPFTLHTSRQCRHKPNYS